jgi:uncharacterized protein (DUF1697 family)
LNKENKVLKQACPDEDENKAILERASQVAAILEAAKVHYPTETEKAEAILSFSRANLSLQEIESLARTMSPQYRIDPINKRTGVM